jgi:hypothetical protein
MMHDTACHFNMMQAVHMSLQHPDMPVLFYFSMLVKYACCIHHTTASHTTCQPQSTRPGSLPQRRQSPQLAVANKEDKTQSPEYTCVMQRAGCCLNSDACRKYQQGAHAYLSSAAAAAAAMMLQQCTAPYNMMNRCCCCCTMDAATHAPLVHELLKQWVHGLAPAAVVQLLLLHH